MPFDQTSETKVPNDESVLDVLPHTAVGIVEYNDVDAVRTTELTFAFIVDTAELIATFNELEAFPIVLPRLDEAVEI